MVITGRSRKPLFPKRDTWVQIPPSPQRTNLHSKFYVAVAFKSLVYHATPYYYVLHLCLNFLKKLEKSRKILKKFWLVLKI